MPSQATVPSFTFALSLVLGGLLGACSTSSSGAPAQPGGDDSGLGQGDDATTGTDASGAGFGGFDGGLSDGGPSGGNDAMTHGDTGPSTDGGGDGGVRDVGSCCVQQSTPGCSNASLEVCVCEKDSTCCTKAWGLQCVFIVQQKYCQPGVRDCVCGTDAGQWGQTSCCSTDWNSSCDSVANIKCNAVQGCF
jgi:hypothetical protein